MDKKDLKTNFEEHKRAHCFYSPFIFDVNITYFPVIPNVDKNMQFCVSGSVGTGKYDLWFLTCGQQFHDDDLIIWKYATIRKLVAA